MPASQLSVRTMTSCYNCCAHSGSIVAIVLVLTKNRDTIRVIVRKTVHRDYRQSSSLCIDFATAYCNKYVKGHSHLAAGGIARTYLGEREVVWSRRWYRWVERC